MGRISYLVGKGADRKLKRNVPKELQALKDKWAWVDRLKGTTAEALKKQAHLFAVRTNAEIETLRRRSRSADTSGNGQPAVLGLDEVGAQQLAVVYFHEMDRRYSELGANFAVPHGPTSRL